MEILKGFSFDIQRFTAPTAPQDLDLSATGAVANNYYFWDDSASTWKWGTVAEVDDANDFVLAFCSATDTFAVNAARTGTITTGSTGKTISNSTFAITTPGTTITPTAAINGTFTFASSSGTYGVTLTATAAATSTLTVNSSGITAAGTTVSAVTVASGRALIGFVQDVTLSASTSVQYATGLNLNATTVTLPSTATVALTETRANNLTATVVDASGNVTGLDVGNVAYDTAGAYTVNNVRYVMTSTGGRIDGASSAGTSRLFSGTLSLGGTNPTSVTTVNDGTFSISTGTASFIAAAGSGLGATNGFRNVSAGSSISAPYSGVYVVTDVTTFTAQSSTITVNNKTFTQGFTTAAYAADALTIVTTTNSALLRNGSVYLNGSGSVTVEGATINAIVAVTKGDITVTATAGGTYAIGDLDNGDSFTVTNGSTSAITYTVSNGRLFDSNGNVSANAIFNASDDTYANVATITNITAGTAFNAAGGGGVNIAAGANLNASHGELAPASDVTGRNMRIGTDNDGTTNFTVTEYANGAYLHSNGVVDSNSSSAIGTLNSDSDGNFTYTATSTQGQTINLGTVPDTGVWNVTGTATGDWIVGNAQSSTLNGGAGNDTVTAAAGNIALGGEGNDTLTASIGSANVTLSGGAGADTLVAVDATTGATTLTGGDGSDVFVIGDAANNARSAVITDFDFANDVLFNNQVGASSAFASLTSAQVNAEGRITLGNGVATVNANNGAYLAQVRGNDNRKQAIGWVGEAATAIDASSLTVGAVIIGNTNTEGDSLYGGSAGDTLYGGAGDTVWGGAGRNVVTLSGAASDAKHVLGFGVDNASAHDVVSGFTTGFEAEDSDKLILVGGVTTVSTSLTGSGAAGQLTIKSGSSDLIMRNVNVNGTTGAAEVRVGDSKVAFVASGSVATVSSASYADMYFGTKNGSVKSGLSFANIEDSLEVNLSDSKYTNIASVTGGTGNTSLLGGSEAETLISAGGNTSLYGGAGKDVLVGRTTAADTFFALDGIGADTISGFEGYTENTAETADTVYLSSVSAAKLGSNGITLNLNDSDKLVLTGTGVNANTEVRFTTDGTTFGIAKIGSVAGGNNFTYAKEVTYYGGGNGNDTLTFSSGDSDDHQVWLDGSKGVSYSKVNIINGASASGSLELAGDSAKNTITGGSGDDSLWGGSGNTADRLVGNSGANTFFYGLGEGKDTLVSGSADDTVNLYNINLSDVMSGEITNAGVTVNMNDGSTLTVATSRDIKFNLASGESYIANHSTKQWDNA